MSWEKIFLIFCTSVLATFFLSAVCFSKVIKVPDEFSMIQEAIDFAVDGDVILVSPDTYVENINFKGKLVIVTSTDGYEMTFIDGSQLGAVVTFDPETPSTVHESVLEGFTIFNGSSSLGGGIACNSASPTIANNFITGNSSGSGGGGIKIKKGTPTITDNIVKGNFAGGQGGGIAFSEDSLPTIFNNFIVENTAIYGGGIYSINSSSKIIINTIKDNEADYGAGIYIDEGGVHLIENNVLFENDADLWGGGFCIAHDTDITINNCTLSLNLADIGGGVYITNSDTHPIIKNTIIWGNSAQTDPQIHGTGPIVTYSLVENGTGEPWFDPATCIDDDPEFVSGLNGDYYLSQIAAGQTVDSPCFNTGDPLSNWIPVTTRTDAEMDTDVIDMGYHYAGTIKVPEYFTTIHEAIDFAIDKSTIDVAPGTYVENIDFNGKAIIIRSRSGPEMTVIDGNQVGSVITFQSLEKPDSVIDGFTITNGTGTPSFFGLFGGGILCRGTLSLSTSPTIKNNIITGNSAHYGDGIGCEYGSDAIIENNLITQNDGHGIWCEAAAPEISNNIIIKNTNDGIHGWDCGSLIKNNIISENFGYGIGGEDVHIKIDGNIISKNTNGGVELYAFSRATIVNNIIDSNMGSGINCDECVILPITITNNTIFGNSVGGIYCNFSIVSATNNILWENKGSDIYEIYLYNGSTLTLSYSDVQGGTDAVYIDPYSDLNWGSGMINADPLFMDPMNGDFHLSLDSPCIDVGDNTAIPQWVTQDFENNPRIVQGSAPGYGKMMVPLGSAPPLSIVDIGADEYYLFGKEGFNFK